MGNWRRVWIVGECPAEQVAPLIAALRVPEYGEDAFPAHWSDSHCLTLGESLCGLPVWPAVAINAVGNLYERDYTPEDVMSAVKQHVLPAAPGIELKIHCGDDYERPRCVCTIVVARGRVELRPPAISNIPEIPDDAIAGRLFSALLGGPR